MTIYIDPTGGFAGDMFSAALISAGADEALMIKAMKLAASKIGKTNIRITKTNDNATRLVIDIQHDHNHLSSHKAKHLLMDIFNELEIEEKYRLFGMTALQNLIDAEIKAHKEHTFLTDHHHLHDHDHHHDHHHGHDHHHHHHDKEEAFLHEAQDILIDIIGATYGLQLLNADVNCILTSPVSIGGGIISFSHGEMSVPAPATQNMIDKFNIPVKRGPVDYELFTPTGAAILSALNVKLIPDSKFTEKNAKTGTSRGTKDLDIKPLKLYITE